MVTPSKLTALYNILEKLCRDKEIIAGKSGRHMKFPYTLSAKIAQFPIFFYMKNSHIWMYYPLGCIIGLYFISYIHEAANSDANKAAWAETQRKNAAKEHH